MRQYSPRRQSKRWLDGDCPKGVLAIYYDRREPSEPYTVFYAELLPGDTWTGRWLNYAGIREDGRASHGEMRAYQVADYRYRNRHRAASWTSLPEEVKERVRSDLEEEKS
jgi:hypothetical protein